MEWQDLLSRGFDYAQTLLESVLKDLSPEDLDWQPTADCNSIGWLAWHLVRQQDAVVSHVMKEKQLWIAGQWHERFKRPPDLMDFGTGQTPEQVAAFKSPPAETIVAYSRAVKERTIKYLRTLTAADLDRVFNAPGFKMDPTVGSWLMSTMIDSIQHAGQAGYVRGLRQGKGWQAY